MKLEYSIPNKLWIISNFLDFKTYQHLHKTIIKERKDINLRSAKGNWCPDLIENIEAPLKVEVRDYPPFEKLKTLIKYNPFYQLKDVKKLNTLVHYMKKGAGINWHDDNKWKYGATYYVNRRWNRNFGGEFMFSHDLSQGWVPVVGNSLVIVKSPMLHKVNPVLTSAMPRISVQVFIK